MQRIVGSLLWLLYVTVSLLTGLSVGYGPPSRRSPYYGRLIGRFAEKSSSTVSGTVYAVDESTFFIEQFSYNSMDRKAVFWIGATDRPSPIGQVVPYPEDANGGDPPFLESYNKTNIILKLPTGKRIKDIKWLSVWCTRFAINFGDVRIPENLEVPKGRVLPEFKRLAHGLRSGNITILDAKTFYIPNLHYDGLGPDAYFLVGNGSEPTSSFGVKVPNEMGSLEPLRAYQGEDIEIQLPGNMTVYDDIDWLAVYCIRYKHNFGHVSIPKDLDVPAALGQTKITPPWWYSPTSSTTPTIGNETEMNNCREMLDNRLQVQWKLQDEYVLIRLAARMREDQFMAFGVSAEDGRPSMTGADIVVAYYDRDLGTFHAVDYYISATAPCDGQNGVCPDEIIGGRNDVELISGERKNGVTVIVYKRPLQTNEPIKDLPIPAEGETSVIAAIGPLSPRMEANAHDTADKTLEDVRIDFSFQNDYSCISSLFNMPEEESVKPWPPIIISDENMFSVRIGPTGGKRGYEAITGIPAWDIAWYINDKLIPELYVERGKSYTFMVEGGNDPINSAKYHPFYITDSPEGGFGQKKELQQREQRVFAGISYDSEGNPAANTAGRYCEWVHKTVDKSLQSDSFEAFFETLRLECDRGEPAFLNWTVAPETPNLVYYQSYTHNNLGWKIHVVDANYRVKPGSKSTSSGASTPVISLSTLSIVILHSFHNYFLTCR